MTPDPESTSSADELEMVDYSNGPQHNGHARGLARRGRYVNHPHANGDNYQVVEIHDAASAITEDDLNSAEDEGLIPQFPDDRSAAGTLDDYFYYGFSNAEAAIDWRCAFWLIVSFLFITFLALVLPGKIRKPIVEEDGTVIFPNGTVSIIHKNDSHFVSYECPAPSDRMHGGENYHNTSVEESYVNSTSDVENNLTGFLEVRTGSSYKRILQLWL